MNASLDEFRAEVIAKLGGLTGSQYVLANPGVHLWAMYGSYQSCAFCMTIRKSNGTPNKPCKGITRIGLRV